MQFLYYDIRVAVLIAVFYMFYRLLLSRDSLHQLNRFVLIGTAVASFVLPLCVITIHHTELIVEEPATALTQVTNLKPLISSQTPWWQIALPIVYWSGVIITLFFTIISISKVCILISRCEKHRQNDGTVIAVYDGEVSPFSWMHFIVMSRSDYAHPDSAILMHEHEHIRRHHSWDVVLVDVLTSLQWFNPAMWMLRSDLRAIHEYEADAAVLSSGVDARQYQYLLVKKAMAVAGYSVVNGINHSTLKQRITMMNVKKQNKYSWFKALYVLPVVAVSLIASAKTVTDYKLVESEKTAVPAEKAVAKQVKTIENTKAIENIVKKEVEKKDSSTSDKTLVVIDGKKIPYNKALGAVKPSDISKIDVIKDKASIAKFDTSNKYDAVIVIETKKEGKNSGDDVVDEKGVYLAPDQLPTYPGGSKEMFKFFTDNIKYPSVAHTWGVQGRVVVSFIVNEDGSISDPKVVYNGTKGKAADEIKTKGTVSEIKVVGYANNKKEGSTATDDEIAKGVKEGQAAIAQEALRLISSMPNWIPGEKDGKPVRAKYNVPITFRLE